MITERPILLFLTDLSNESEEEDIIISNYLRDYFKIILCHPDDCQDIEEKVGGIIIRNTWNDSKYGKPGSGYYERFRKKGLKVHDYLYTYPGEDKDYLIDLYKKGYPVIPSVDTVKSLSQVPETDVYFIKPKDGFSAIGARKITKEELIELNPEYYLIQPFVDFEYEISFYYIDKKLQHVLYAPNKEDRWALIPFTPSEHDLSFAQQFIEWNPQKYGIERIDACRLKDGSLLLVEITDQGGVYLSMPLLSDSLRENFLKNLVISIERNVFGKVIV